MDGMPTIDSDALVALSRAIDTAMDRGDMDEAIRLSSLQAEEMNRWLQANGYPPLDYGDSCLKRAAAEPRRPPTAARWCAAVGQRATPQRSTKTTVRAGLPACGHVACAMVTLASAAGGPPCRKLTAGLQLRHRRRPASPTAWAG
jgi:hypothetical protein